MSLLENDDLPTINPFHVHVREPCFLESDPNFKLQVCNEVLWTLRKSSAKEIATCFFNCLWELGFRLAFQKSGSSRKPTLAFKGKELDKKEGASGLQYLLTSKNSVASPGMNYVHYDKKVSA